MILRPLETLREPLRIPAAQSSGTFHPDLRTSFPGADLHGDGRRDRCAPGHLVDPKSAAPQASAGFCEHHANGAKLGVVWFLNPGQSIPLSREDFGWDWSTDGDCCPSFVR